MKNKNMLFGGLILLECLLWGLGNPIVKIAYESTTAFYSIAIRYSMALLFFSVLFGRQFIKLWKRAYLKPCLIVSLFTAASFITSPLSIRYTSATTAGFLMSLAVLFSPFLSYFLLKTKVDKRSFIPIAIVVVGMYFLCNVEGGFSFGLGELLALFSSFTLGCVFVLSAKYVPHIDPILLAVCQTAATFFSSLLIAVCVETAPVFSQITGRSWAAMLYLAVCCTAVAYLLQNNALRHVEPVYASLIFCSEPIFTAAAAYFILGEILSAKGLLGAGLVLASIVIASVIQEFGGEPEKVLQPEGENPNDGAGDRPD